LLGRQLDDPSLAQTRMLSVDAYLAQHPGVPGRQAAQSAWVHLVGLCLVLECGFDGLASARAKALVATPRATFEWLDPPAWDGRMTVLDVLTVTTQTDHRDTVRRWATDVWVAWERHHSAIRERASAIASDRRPRPAKD